MISDPFNIRTIHVAGAGNGVCPVLMVYDRNSASRALFENLLSRTTDSTSKTPARSEFMNMRLAITSIESDERIERSEKGCLGPEGFMHLMVTTSIERDV